MSATSIWGVNKSSSVWRWSNSVLAVNTVIDVAVGKVSLEAYVVSEKDIIDRVLASSIGLGTEIIVESVSALVLANGPLIRLILSALVKFLLQLTAFKLVTSPQIL